MSDLFSRLGSAAVRSAAPPALHDPFAGAADTGAEALSPVIDSTLAATTEHSAREPVVALTQTPTGEVSARAATPMTGPSTHQRGEAHPEGSRETPDVAATSSATASPPSPVELAPLSPSSARQPATNDDSAPSRTATGPAAAALDEVRSIAPVAVSVDVVDAAVRLPDPTFGAAPHSTVVDSPVESRPTVRVHIGRLDVRANLEAKPTPAPTKRSGAVAGADSPSLGDYLSGHRVRS